MTGIDKILDSWNLAKGQEAAAKKKIEQCRKQVETFLDDAAAVDLVTAKNKVQKRLQPREVISKKDVPANIWAQYAKRSNITVLAFTALTGRRSTAGKAKAKTRLVRDTSDRLKAKLKGK